MKTNELKTPECLKGWTRMDCSRSVYFHFNGMTISATPRKNGSVVWSYDNWPFGKPTQDTPEECIEGLNASLRKQIADTQMRLDALEGKS